MTTSNVVTIAPDGVDIDILADKFVVGASIFVPCINTERAKRQLRELFALGDKKLVFRVCVVDGKYGMRVWMIREKPVKRGRGSGRKR